MTANELRQICKNENLPINEREIEMNIGHYDKLLAGRRASKARA